MVVIWLLHIIFGHGIILASTSGKILALDNGYASITCSGHNYQEQFFTQVLSHFGTPIHTSDSALSANQSPECKISVEGKTLVLKGLAEISSTAISYVVTLAKAKFSFDLPNPGLVSKSDNDYLIVYSTLFESGSYFKSVSNLCDAVNHYYKPGRQFLCYFIDVIKHPEVLVTNKNPVPWISVKISKLRKSPYVISDPFPTLGTLKQALGISENVTHGSQYLYPSCIDSEHFTCSVTDPILSDHTFWVNEVMSYRENQVNKLGKTGIVEAPEEIIRIISPSGLKRSDIDAPDIVFVFYTLDPTDCGSCSNAMEELKVLNQEIKASSSKLFFVNCDESVHVCASQNVTGFPSLMAYKNIQYDSTDHNCFLTKNVIDVISFHGAYKAANMIEWYQDLNDLGIHYEQPHEFHSGCNVHIEIKASNEVEDKLSLSCMESVCKMLSYSECFILKDDSGDVYIKSIELTRRDGVSSMIYIDGQTLGHTFSSTQEIHEYHDNHNYDIPDCKLNPALCLLSIQRFIKEHSRVPVTELNPQLFHSHTAYTPLFGDLPVLAALVRHDTILAGTDFMRMLNEVAKLFYRKIATSFIDVDRYPYWVSGMVPRSGSDMEWVHEYPRVLIFHLHDHKNAAFLKVSGDKLTRSELVTFVEDYLKTGQVEPCIGF